MIKRDFPSYDAFLADFKPRAWRRAAGCGWRTITIGAR